MSIFSLTVTKQAEGLIRKQMRWSFWIRNPVVLLVAEGRPGPEGPEVLEARQSGAGMEDILEIHRKHHGDDTIFDGKRLVPRIVAGHTFSSRKMLIRASGLLISPHMKMIGSPSPATQWQLDVGEKGLVLLADGVVVAGMSKKSES